MKKILNLFLPFVILTMTTAIVAPMFNLTPVNALAWLAIIGFVGHLATKNMKQVAFDTIPIVQAMGVFTQTIIGVFKDSAPVKDFLASWFPNHYSNTFLVDIVVRRGTRRVAYDVFRYSDGQRNTFDKATMKEFKPPFFHEHLDISDHALYDASVIAIANGQVDQAANLAKKMAEDFVELRKKIERRKELQRAQAIQTGVVTLTSGDNIDFKRKGASIVGYSGAVDFSIGTVDPSEILKTGCEFIRTEGMTDEAIFDLILGDEAYSALINNTIIKGRNDIKQYTLDQIASPTMSTNGAAFHGELSCGSYKVRLWTYPQKYQTNAGVDTNYIDSKKVILLPSTPIGTTENALVPQLPKNGRIQQTGEYFIQDEMKEIEGIHRMHLKSAVLPVLTRVDRVYTVTVLN